MKKYLTYLLVTSFVLCGCNNKNDFITYKEYVDIESSAIEGQKDIFVFTAENCPHCKKIEKSLDKYIKDNKDINIYRLSLDTKSNAIGRTIFKDNTMGAVTGDISDDNIKKLDNRIEEYLKETKEYLGFDSKMYKASTGYYSYVMTPLIIFYDSGIEVNIINNVESQLEYQNNKVVYESFVKMMEYPETYPNWSKPFDLAN